jgi:hypothetical protein
MAPKASTPKSAPKDVQPTGVTRETAARNELAAKAGDANALDRTEPGLHRRTTNDAGQALLDAKLEKPINTVKNVEAAPKEDATEKERENIDKPAPIRSVAQLRDAGIAAGVQATSGQVEEMRKIETEGLEELSKKVRGPAAER